MRYLLIILLFISNSLWAQPGPAMFFALNGGGAQPTTVSLVAQFQADKGITLSGSNVQSWLSQDGSGALFSQPTTGQQPLYVTNAYNGLPCLRFNSTSYWMSVSNVSFSGYTALSVFIVGKNAASDDGSLLGTYNGVSGSWMVYSFNNRFQVAGMGGTPSITPVTSSLVLLEAAMDATAQKTWAGGVQTYSGAGGTIGGGGTELSIGRYSGTAGKGMTAFDLCEILIYNRVLTDSERIVVETYLKTKWGL